MAKVVTLQNGRYWKTQREALLHFKAMLARYKNGDRITNASDHDDLCALIARYDGSLPTACEKSCAGINYFSRQHNGSERWTTDGFYVHRIDGTSESFSYIHAVLIKERDNLP